MDDSATTYIALCPGCAKETGLDDDDHLMEPDVVHDLACNHCGAQLGGFFYRVPADAYSGMAPGAG